MLRLRCADAAVVLHVTSLHVANLSAQTSQRCCTRAPASVGGVRRCRRCRGGVEAVSRRCRLTLVSMVPSLGKNARFFPIPYLLSPQYIVYILYKYCAYCAEK